MRHPTKRLRLFLASLAAAGWLVVALSLTMSASFAQGPVRDLTAQSANIYAGAGGSLSAARGEKKTKRLLTFGLHYGGLTPWPAWIAGFGTGPALVSGGLPT